MLRSTLSKVSLFVSFSDCCSKLIARVLVPIENGLEKPFNFFFGFLFLTKFRAKEVWRKIYYYLNSWYVLYSPLYTETKLFWLPC
jgi:hypothetical protein